MVVALLLAVMGEALFGETVRLERRGAYVIVPGVYVMGQGPFRFLLDTGAQTCALREEVAARIGLTPAWRVEMVTAAGSSLVPAASAGVVRVGAVERTDVETLIGGMQGVRGVGGQIDGVLGQSFFGRLNYLLDLRGGELTLGLPERAVSGARLPFTRIHDRPVVSVEVDGRIRRLGLDSGAAVLVLFGGGPPSLGAARLLTNAGGAAASAGTRVVRVGKRRFWLSSAETTALSPDGRVDGLLPASVFRSVYVNNEAQYVVLDAISRPVLPSDVSDRS
jgi:hypothetical protein